MRRNEPLQKLPGRIVSYLDLPVLPNFLPNLCNREEEFIRQTCSASINWHSPNFSF
jgi:hypothetical protein